MNDSQLNKYLDRTGIVEIDNKNDVRHKLNPYKKKIEFSELK